MLSPQVRKVLHQGPSGLRTDPLGGKRPRQLAPRRRLQVAPVRSWPWVHSLQWNDSLPKLSDVIELAWNDHIATEAGDPA